MEMRSGAWSEPPSPAPTSAQWRVSPGFVGLKCGVTVLLVIAAVFFADDRRVLTAAVVAALVAAGYALRDLLAPVRLAADPEGLTVVTGYAGHRRLTWPEVERIRVDTRSRAGLRSELLEIDTGDTLHLFSMYDLNTHPSAVAEDLDRIRALGIDR
ncbi:PH domain-containing protein [Dactylosporangium sp. AC04546]|uniref:PH domain-containing protein n=1 Tax=Dactylosporangium sp. AC04546 TaxID=2862460 RepID=UPI001EDE704B|nr:PH domain-containing protein [Dactylosporangium sp. AC04546]WVK84003.1 PH domain-containing protein [Dactylosporangium sp. AC04546]